MATKERVFQCLKDFLHARKREQVRFSEKTHLFFDLGLKSEDGVYFVLDLCEALEFEFPLDFNPFTDKTERRIVRVGEMANRIEQVMSETGALT